jgi:solute carrier family 25 S-adenosylmethionine transporter 26
MAVATSAVLGKVGTEVSSLYRGVFGAAGGAGLAIGAYFAFYGAAKKALEQNTDFSVSTVAFVAGGVGALGSSIVKVPAAVCIRSVQANVYPNVIVAARSITKAAGPRGMFTGYLPTLLEDVPDMAVKFAAYETMRTMHRRVTGMKPEDSHAAADISMGLIAGAVAAGATTPLDVVKTRMMCNASQRPSFAGAIAGVWRDSPPGMGRAKTFFTGVGPRAFSNGINSAIFFCFFEQLRVVFKQQDERRALQREAREREATAVAVDESGRRGRARGDAGARGDAVDAVYTTAKRQMRVTEASMTLAQKRGAAAKK